MGTAKKVSVSIVIPTVPRRLPTLTNTADSIASAIQGASDIQVFILQNAPDHPEALEVAKRHGWELVDQTTPHPARPQSGVDPKRAWETKLSLDFARSLERGAQTGSDLVLLLEDDIVVSSRFLESLYSHSWLTVLFSRQHGINNWYHHFLANNQALLFRNDHRLTEFVQYLRDHAHQQPADWLLRDFLLERRYSVSQRIPNSVEHVGYHSSMSGETRPDRSYTYHPHGRAYPPLQVYWAIRYLVTTCRLRVEYWAGKHQRR